uniref:basic leucine zipper 23-like n=1 Tax=Erigeron canadensis TaxID=72917 RepID=UPI001CB97F0D|nr:basic leucine zipper 23-like [Erigeron canadensis]
MQRKMDDGDIEVSYNLTRNSTSRSRSKLEDSMLHESLENENTCIHTCLDDHVSKKPVRGASGNRVAVKKYREKKKAHNAYLEEEVKKLRVVNRGLVRKLQFQAALEAEAVRLRSLLMDLKSQIGKELGVSRFYIQSCNDSYDCCIGGD